MRDTAMSVRLFEDRDLPGVLDLLRASLGESETLRRTPELFAWKHLENPFGKSIMLVAEDGDTITGFRAFMRWQLDRPGAAPLQCVRAVDTATHPDYQRRGIFRQLTLAALDVATSDGIDMVFNTPNPRSGAGYLTMGWSQVGVIRPLASPARGILRFSPETESGPRIDDFVRGAQEVSHWHDRPALGLRTPRSEQYTTWRFRNHPTATYVQIDGKRGSAVARLAFRGKRRELLISDVYGNAMNQTIRQSRRAARTSYIGAFFSKGSPERSAAYRSGLVPVPGAKLTLMVRELRTLDVDVTDFGNWDLSLSDLELL
ncbi:MAG: GNAT family N-acetyltransferase [Acidimicrobiia bacterium]